MSGCVFARLGNCAGWLDSHHVLKQQHIRKRFPYGGDMVGLPEEKGSLVPLSRWDENPEVSLADLLADRRNLVPCCRAHHDALHWARVYLDPPESAIAFATELGLLHVLEKQKERAA